MEKGEHDELTPLDEITDGYRFQRIVAELFQCLKKEKHNYSIVDVEVNNSGVGPDGGCDILVEFFFEDIIAKHSHKWVIECKCHEESIGINDINTNNINMILNNKRADGYLLVCKKDASSSLIDMFNKNNENSEKKYYIWNGDKFWHLCVNFHSLIKAFFPKYYRDIIAKDEKEFSSLAEKYEKEGGVK